MKPRIGFIQGRLSELVEGRIQAFPWENWRSEFPIANEMSIRLMEWTLDQQDLYANPLMTEAGQCQIKKLMQAHSISIPSLTGDCFMQSPFWKAAGEERRLLEWDFLAIIKSCSSIGVSMAVVPLVDNGRLENIEQEQELIEFLGTQSNYFIENQVKIIFESDFEPERLLKFIDQLDPQLFGVNYDIGNSAALGFDPKHEISLYGHRIYNVHVKDRALGGSTVPLGVGNADFKSVFKALAEIAYSGNYILQTARAHDGCHRQVLEGYRNQLSQWIAIYGA